MAIPILAIPVLNRGDLLLRCIRSIDYPVDKLVIVNNGDDPVVAAVLEQLSFEADFDLRIHKPKYNLGVAGSWNWIIRENPADYWLLVGNDMAFAPRDLRKMDTYIRAHSNYVIMPANWGHSLFAVTPVCIESVGWFDENYYPAYSEDQDQMYRIQLAGVPWGDVPDICAMHGEPPLWGSTTVWSDPKLLKWCQVTQPNNHRYHEKKWGGEPGKETWIHPYNRADLTLRDWIIDHDLALANNNPWVSENENGR